MGVRQGIGLTAVLIMWLVQMSGEAAEPRVERGGGDSGTVGTQITVPAQPARSGGLAVPDGALVNSGSGATSCTYRAISPEEALAAGLLSPDDGGVENLWGAGGQYVLRDCSASGAGRLILWVPAADGGPGPGGVALVTPGMLAVQARNTLQLPTPAVGVSPDGLNENPALVNLPTWWWVTNGDALTQRTELGGVWAEVTAVPVSSVWVAGDGERSECAGLGVAYLPGMREDQPGRCSHTYGRANASEQAQIQVVWQVSWVGSGGTGGTLEPFMLTTTQAVPVYERHAIVTSSG